MREELMGEKQILKFYKEFVSLIQGNIVSNAFLEHSFIIMLMGREFQNNHLNNIKSYELALILSLFSDGNKDLESLKEEIYPFNIVDESYYYNLLADNQLLLMELLMLKRLAGELENKKDSVAVQLLRIKNNDCIKTFDNFYKLKDILRAGWIRRNVDDEYLESDATHIMQMMALASAYFTVFKPSDLDYIKVMEMILIHEVGEVLAGDIPEGDSLHSSKHDIEARGVRDTFGNLENGIYFINLWEEFEAKVSNEAKFVYELDKLDPILKAAYLDGELKRTDLLPDFYEYEERRETFKNSKLKKIFMCLNK